MMTMTSTAPIARAQSTPLIGGGLTALPKVNMGANLAQNSRLRNAGTHGLDGRLGLVAGSADETLGHLQLPA